MKRLDSKARLRERAYTMWEEAGDDESLSYNLWHKLRRLLAPASLSARDEVRGKPEKPDSGPH